MPKSLPIAAGVLAVSAVLGWIVLRDDMVPPAPAPPGQQGVPTGDGPAAVDDAGGANGMTVDREVADVAAVPIVESVPSPTQLWGHVVESGTGTPVAGAEIELQRRDAEEFQDLDVVRSARIATLARARSDHDGTFHFDVERARPHRLAVRAAGYAPVTLTGRMGGSDVVIEVARGAAVHGVVRSGDRLLPDMDVRLVQRGTQVELASGPTDVTGAFQFTGLPAVPVYVQVQSAAFQQQWQQLDLVVAGEHVVTVDMLPGVSPHGRVVDANTDMPIATAEVADSWTFKRRVHCDAEGRFELRGVRDGRFAPIYVRAGGYASTSVNLSGKLGEEVVLRLVRGGEVVGRIVDAGGHPVAAAHVAVAASYSEAPGMQGIDWITAEVAADGRFRATGLRPDQHYWVTARHPGLGTRTYALAGMVPSGERVDLGDLVLRAAAGIEGRVIDDAGLPLADQDVAVRGANDDGRRWLAPDAHPSEVYHFMQRSVRTNERGVFRITALAQGSYDVSVRPPGCDRSLQLSVPVVDGAVREGVELVVPKGLTIAGSVVLPDGLSTNDMPWTRLDAVPARGERHSVRIAADGAFRFEHMQAGVFLLSVSQPPKGWAVAPLPGVAAGASDVHLSFEPAAVVSGRVVDAAGRPVRAWVYAEFDGLQHRLLAESDGDGRFRFEVPPGFRGAVGASIQQKLLSGRISGVVAGQSDLVVVLQRR